MHLEEKLKSLNKCLDLGDRRIDKSESENLRVLGRLTGRMARQ